MVTWESRKIYLPLSLNICSFNLKLSLNSVRTKGDSARQDRDCLIRFYFTSLDELCGSHSVTLHA